MKVASIYLDAITVPSRHRGLDPERVRALADSMNMIGLLQPISIWSPDLDTAELVSGNHRRAAAELLGWEEIDCVFVDMDDIDRELAEIDENLIRAELTPAETDAHLKRRAELFEARKAHKESGKSFPTLTGRGNKAFAQDTAEKTGQSKRSINQKLARAEALGNDTLTAVKGTSLDKGVELDALAKIPEQERSELIAKAKAGEAVSARQHVPQKPPTAEARQKEIDREYAALVHAWMGARQSVRQRFVTNVVNAPAD